MYPSLIDLEITVSRFSKTRLEELREELPYWYEGVRLTQSEPQPAEQPCPEERPGILTRIARLFVLEPRPVCGQDLLGLALE